MPFHPMLPATPSFGVSPALDNKASENNKNNTTEGVLLAQNDYRKLRFEMFNCVKNTCIY